ncbi:hypothetical protein [Herbidospora sp. RD11066]
MITLDTLTTRTGRTFDDHLDRTLTIPVLAGMQAQGDLIVIPGGAQPAGEWEQVPAEGTVLLDGVHPHVLFAEPGTCRVQAHPADLALIEATAPVYLMHPEHGATGLAPGVYVARRQREWRESAFQDVCD